jgi:hypothetical protein
VTKAGELDGSLGAQSSLVLNPRSLVSRMRKVLTGAPSTGAPSTSATVRSVPTQTFKLRESLLRPPRSIQTYPGADFSFKVLHTPAASNTTDEGLKPLSRVLSLTCNRNPLNSSPFPINHHHDLPVLLAGVATIMNDSDDEENFGHDALGPPPERISRRLRASVLKRDGNYCLVYGSMITLQLAICSCI